MKKNAATSFEMSIIFTILTHAMGRILYNEELMLVAHKIQREENY
jgi:hypothetical protein